MQKKLVNSQLSNMKTYRMYRREMITLAENVFEFKNLPSYMDKAFINSVLVSQGAIAFFYDDILKELVALPFTVRGEPDIYGRPNYIMARASNGRYYRGLNKDEFVIMYDNNGYYPIFIDICQRAERIALCKRTIDVNIVQQRTPRIWKTNPDNKRTLENLLTEIDGMMENVVAYDSLELEDIEVVQAPAPFVTDKIDIHLDKEWAEFYSFIGVANVMEQKRERVIKNEMTYSQGGTIASRFSRFTPRCDAVKLINEKFGKYLDKEISVAYYDGLPTSLEVENEINNDLLKDEEDDF